MRLAIWKQPQFLIGSFILLSMIILSFMSPLFFDPPQEVKYLYEDGKLVDVAPFSPSQVPPFGTDKFGRNLLTLLINGAKYTLLIAIVIAVFRVFLSGLFAIVYHHYNVKLRPLLEDLVESTIFVPTSILAYLLLAPLAVKQAQEGIGFFEIVVIQCIILIFIGVPPLISIFSKDMGRITRKEHIVSTLSLGAKHRYVYIKHVLPEMGSRFLLVIAQQIIQVLILLAHLGVLLIFLGGVKTILDGDLLSTHEVFVSLTGEWSGLIGNNFQEIVHSPHVILVPLGFFSLTIFSMNLIINGMQNTMKKIERGAGS
ncbi:hypothetical protein [Pseudalkalibacillus salsuginis]|uniref:hypothetical protein n=1 Tax=Pseudalkalibacillus salsuginis TaxID=2910972 RepID=UPI001F2696B1|nr:hypothetical protein [Pseudalkalibacillus salsuginis]MCF6410351.1 hypothetical protein [Pseudalkalibacillus salsuginis]